jgi:alanyl-tRNA synthetase
VSATGDIGTIKIIAESSIGSNLRRIEAVTGENAVKYIQRTNDILQKVSAALGTKSDDAISGVVRKLDELKAAQDEIKTLRARLAAGRASELSAGAVDGVVVERIDGLSANDLRDLALAIRQQSGIRAVVLAGETDTGGVSLVAATLPALKLNASDFIKDAARAVGGGGGGKGDVATAGGKNPAGIEDALHIARDKAREIIASAS